MQKQSEYLHSWYVLVMIFFNLLFLLVNRHLYLDVPLYFFSFFILFMNGLTLRQFSKLCIYAFIFSFSIFLLGRIHPGKEATMEMAVFTMVRIFLVSLLSMSSGLVIDYTKIVLHLIVHKGLRLFWGYPLLLALNSIALFKEEYERIKINARLRDLPLKDRLFIFFPLLVFAIRHSQRGALSLVTRGLNKEKSFYFSYDVSSSDKKKLIMFWSLYLVLVGLAICPLR
ncbi:MAG: hypothetical protein ACXVLQ_08250 [Bacteriovorax sp.]